MATEGEGTTQGGFLARTWRRLRRPSTHWSVLTLVALGVLVGFGMTVGTQVMVEVTGTDKFCGTACHSMQWVAKEHRESVHGVNRTGVRAACHDCHIPRHYPELLWYKAKAGIKDVFGELRGVINTEEKFKKERLRMAREVWDEYKGNNSENCRTCHQLTPEVLAKQKDFVKPVHQQVLEGKATCIDCHKGVGHTAPTE